MIFMFERSWSEGSLCALFVASLFFDCEEIFLGVVCALNAKRAIIFIFKVLNKV
jgi:hypothetical protein